MGKEVTLRGIIRGMKEISGCTMVGKVILKDLKELEKRIVDFEEIRDCSDEEFRGMMFVCDAILGKKAEK